MSLPWDVYATPIAARKLARLGIEHGASCCAPRSTASSVRPTARSPTPRCPLEGHDAPGADCSCGFYAVADDTQLWRLGADEPELAVLDVELAGRVIEHDHGYRASDQRGAIGPLPRRVRAVRQAGRRVRAPALRRPRARVPALRVRGPSSRPRCPTSLGVPVELTTDDPAPAPLVKRLQFVLAQLVAPVLILLVTAAVALATGSGIPLACGQLAIVVWLVTRPVAARRAR